MVSGLRSILVLQARQGTTWSVALIVRLQNEQVIEGAGLSFCAGPRSLQDWLALYPTRD